MSIQIDHQLREFIPHSVNEFPITYFHDELITLTDLAGPLHWHPDFEIASAVCGTLDYQVGGEQIVLQPGDSIFVNGNMLHGIKQLSGDVADPMPNIVFSGTLLAPESSTVYRKYVLPILRSDMLPFVVFRHDNTSLCEISRIINDIYRYMSECQNGYELAVQRNINLIFEYLNCNFDLLPKTQSTRIQMNNQIRIQKMLLFIYENYAKEVTLQDIADAADVSRSEAGRCFQTYMGCSPIDALIDYRLQMAHQLLNEGAQSLKEISYACGFNSVNYFSRRFKLKYGFAPSIYAQLGK